MKTFLRLVVFHCFCMLFLRRKSFDPLELEIQELSLELLLMRQKFPHQLRLSEVRRKASHTKAGKSVLDLLSAVRFVRLHDDVGKSLRLGTVRDAALIGNGDEKMNRHVGKPPLSQTEKTFASQGASVFLQKPPQRDRLVFRLLNRTRHAGPMVVPKTKPLSVPLALHRGGDALALNDDGEIAGQNEMIDLSERAV